ncbi:MAG: glucose-1-phosphate cytidylyltransferase [Lachnospiraceae bacterium]|nr:glucose-1-phosphate cytidylyltransferase [Lachnospiraceae bacterium]
MKVVLLAGGFGTRISEESHLKPKPMIEIGGKPILWHIMKEYSYYGYNEFIICCGYKQQVIKEWFANYYLHNSDVTFDFTEENKMEIHTNVAEPWKVTLVDTGLNTMTGGRIKRIQSYIDDEPFMLTYGDGVSDVNIKELEKFHQAHGKIATMTAVNAGQKFGVLEVKSDGTINRFREKSDSDGDVINAGYMVMNPDIFDYIEGDSSVFEKEPIERIAADGQLVAYMHQGFWKCMDTQRDKQQLEDMIANGNAPWMVWENGK